MDLEMPSRNIQTLWHFSGNHHRANILPNRVSFGVPDKFCDRPVENAYEEL